MGVQDNTEKVLRALHVMLSKGEQYPKEPSKVIVDKQQMLDLLKERAISESVSKLLK